MFGWSVLCAHATRQPPPRSSPHPLSKKKPRHFSSRHACGAILQFDSTAGVAESVDTGRVASWRGVRASSFQCRRSVRRSEETRRTRTHRITHVRVLVHARWDAVVPRAPARQCGPSWPRAAAQSASDATMHRRRRRRGRRCIRQRLGRHASLARARWPTGIYSKAPSGRGGGRGWARAPLAAARCAQPATEHRARGGRCAAARDCVTRAVQPGGSGAPGRCPFSLPGGTFT